MYFDGGVAPISLSTWIRDYTWAGGAYDALYPPYAPPDGPLIIPSSTFAFPARPSIPKISNNHYKSFRGPAARTSLASLAPPGDFLSGAVFSNPFFKGLDGAKRRSRPKAFDPHLYHKKRRLVKPFGDTNVKYMFSDGRTVGWMDGKRLT